MLLGNVLQALYNTVDSFWVGRFLGANALAAVSVSFPILFALIALVIGITMATTVMVSQFAGAGQPDRVQKTINNALTLLTVSGIAISVLGLIFVKPLLRLVNTPPEIMADATSYLAIYISGLIFMFLYNALSAILRGLGDSRTPLRFLVYATVSNIILDPLMIFGVWPFPRMGVAGAALATVLAQALSVVLAVIHINKLHREHGTVYVNLLKFDFDKELSMLTLKIGLPAGMQQVALSLGGIVIGSIINSFGTTVAAAAGAGGRLDQFAIMPAQSVSLAVSALVGQNLGAGKTQRVHESVRSGIMVTTVITLFFTLVAEVIPGLVLRIFIIDPAVLAVGTEYLRIVGATYAPLAVMFIFNGALRGAGDTLPTMFFTITSLWIVRVPLASYLAKLWGSNGVWWAIAASQFVGLAIAWAYFATGRWQRVSVVKHRNVAVADD
jgi:putative MATE family efflux protein